MKAKWKCTDPGKLILGSFDYSFAEGDISDIRFTFNEDKTFGVSLVFILKQGEEEFPYFYYFKGTYTLSGNEATLTFDETQYSDSNGEAWQQVSEDSTGIASQIVTKIKNFKVTVSDDAITVKIGESSGSLKTAVKTNTDLIGMWQDTDNFMRFIFNDDNTCMYGINAYGTPSYSKGTYVIQGKYCLYILTESSTDSETWTKAETIGCDSFKIEITENKLPYGGRVFNKTDKTSIKWSENEYNCFVTYNSDYAEDQVPETLVIPVGSKLTAEQLPTLTEDGYLFIGWYSLSDETETIITADTLEVTEPLFLYAKWEMASVVGSYDYIYGETPFRLVLTSDNKFVMTICIPNSYGLVSFNNFKGTYSRVPGKLNLTFDTKYSTISGEKAIWEDLPTSESNDVVSLYNKYKNGYVNIGPVHLEFVIPEIDSWTLVTANTKNDSLIGLWYGSLITTNRLRFEANNVFTFGAKETSGNRYGKGHYIVIGNCIQLVPEQISSDDVNYTDMTDTEITSFITKYHGHCKYTLSSTGLICGDSVDGFPYERQDDTKKLAWD